MRFRNRDSIGVGMYQITTAMWVRGFLQHDYGVYPEELIWVTEMPELGAR